MVLNCSGLKARAQAVLSRYGPRLKANDDDSRRRRADPIFTDYTRDIPPNEKNEAGILGKSEATATSEDFGHSLQHERRNGYISIR